ncbi:MAG: transposase family protein [Bacteroidota bacterium]
MLLKILNQALEDLQLLPVRNGSELRDQLDDHYNQHFHYDGTDRGVQRSENQQRQREHYSGKHREHTVKNLTLCDDRQYVHYLSATCPGKQHDKSIADEFPIELPPGSCLKQDLGFLGHDLQGVIVETPFKKPKNQELTFSQKLYNQILAEMRIVVEHANSGIKRLRMLKDQIRLHSSQIRDQVMEVACGIHNLRVNSPQRAYPKLTHARARTV